MTTLEDLTEIASDLPPLDKPPLSGDPTERYWQERGYAVLPKLMPDALIDTYCEAWKEVNDERTGRSRWPACAYMHSEAILDLCLYRPLVERLRAFVGGDVGLHLCLTGWRSTTRDWHQDDYLNPPFVNSWYAAAWIALADVDPDCGPFEVIEGSHRWPRLRRERVLHELGLDMGDPSWPEQTERRLTPLVQAEIDKLHLKPVQFHLKRGDVLIWHGGLYHRGTVPKNPDLERRACIAHYSAVHKRPDMHEWSRHGSGLYYDHFQPLTDGKFAP